ncbi:hypothetical protein FRC01_009743, partial [Tulasnella sp. 417]
KWCDAALDELWRDLWDIYPVLKLLVPFESFYAKYNYGALEYQQASNLLPDVDWPRFQQYSTRVKSITFDESAVKIGPPSREGISFLILHHPYGNCLTPNLQNLRWTLSNSATITAMLPFISQRLEYLRMDIQLESMETQEVFFGLTHRTPALKRLSIESEASPSDISPSFSGWIRTCIGLEKAHIPRRWQTSSVVTAFGSLPNLVEFGLEWSLVPKEYMRHEMEMRLTEGSFRSLRRLGWSSNMDTAQDLLYQAPCRLQGLALDCPWFQSQAEVIAFISTAADRCPDLDSFCLNLTNFVDGMEPDGDPELFDLGILRPLLACRRLRELCIHYPGRCILSTTDLEEMGAAWPNMEELVLCPDPNAGEHGTPISRLPLVATAFPRIRILGLYLDHSDPPSSAGDLLPEIQFKCLEELHVGASPIPAGDTASVGLYLASLFAAGTRPLIRAEESGARSNYFYGSLFSESWTEVERWVHLTMGVKEAVLCRLSGR